MCWSAVVIFISQLGLNDDVYWIAKNSWGKEWGQLGFVWIKMGEANIDLNAATSCIVQ